MLCLLPLLAVAASPQELTQTERSRAMSELHATRKQFLDAVAGLSPAQWNFKPSPGAWSIAECAEHIALSEDLLFRKITGQIMASPARPEQKAQVKGKDETVIQVIEDRTHKAQTPPSLAPAKRWPERTSLVQHFKQSRDATISYVETTHDRLREHFAAYPALGPVDGYQWILLMAAHTARHVAQMEAVKANPNYPAR